MKSRQRNVSHRSACGFTLIELLVVVAIVAILAAILMPALRTTRKKAWQVVCASQLRQLGIIFQLYANDNDSWLPQSLTPAGATWVWALESAETGGVGYLRWVACCNADPMTCPDSVKLLNCPTSKDYWRYCSGARCYGMCYYEEDEGNPFIDPYPSMRLGDRSKPPQAWLLADTTDRMVPDAEIYMLLHGGSAFALRHLGKGNVLHWDFSVSVHTNEDAKVEGFHDGVNDNIDFGT